MHQPFIKQVPLSTVLIIATFSFSTFPQNSHMINIAGIIYYTCSLVIDIQCTCYNNAFNKRFLQIVCQNKIYSEKNSKALAVCNAVYFRLCIDLILKSTRCSRHLADRSYQIPRLYLVILICIRSIHDWKYTALRTPLEFLRNRS